MFLVLAKVESERLAVVDPAAKSVNYHKWRRWVSRHSQRAPKDCASWPAACMHVCNLLLQIDLCHCLSMARTLPGFAEAVDLRPPDGRLTQQTCHDAGFAPNMAAMAV